MSRFFSSRYQDLTPYTPGEQPQDMQYVKLNTNESPFPPSEKAIALAAEAMRQSQLYPDPEGKALHGKLATVYGVAPDEVIAANGSDEALNFAVMAFADEAHPLAFPNISYGFYPVFAALNHVPYTEIPLAGDLSVRVADYTGIGKTVLLANPNAPTGVALSRGEIEQIVRSNPDNVVIIDEAYVDFGAESAVPLVHQYGNLLVIQTFSKARSLAGARLGYCIGNAALIRDLNTIKYAVNPYNVSRATMAAGIGALSDEAYTQANCRAIMENRAYTADALTKLGFQMTPSRANFLFARHPQLDGGDLYRGLKARGVLVRHFTNPLIDQYVRITIGTMEQMQTLIDTIQALLEENA